jgi:hypothetical protein
VGVDVVDILHRSKSKSFRSFFEPYEESFTLQEFRAMLAESSEDARFTKFHINWSLKEAFTKAIGNGLGFNFRDVSQLT